jgi:hypothetical protein
MRQTLLFGMALALTGVTTILVPAEQTKANGKANGPYVHVVIFRMKKDAPKEAVEKAIADCHEWLAKAPGVCSVRAGRPADKGTPGVPKMEYDFALLVLLENADALQEYLDSALHKKFLDRHEPSFEMTKVQVFDFMNQMK